MFFVDPYNELDPAIIHDASATWTADNRVLKAGQFGVETDTRKFKIGDGVTTWTSLDYEPTAEELDNKQDRTSELLTGGLISVGDYDVGGSNNDIRATASTYFIEGQGEFSAAQTTFNNIANCTAGNTKYIDIFGLTDGTVTKVEGTEGVGATHPTPPANSVRLGYVHWGDAGSLGTGTSTTEYLVPLVFGWNRFSPADSTFYYVQTTGTEVPITTNTAIPAVVPKTGTMFSASIGTRHSSAATLETLTFEYQINNSTWQTITTTFSLAGSIYGSGVTYTHVNLSAVSVVEGDTIMLRFTTPAWVTNPTNLYGTVILYIE